MEINILYTFFFIVFSALLNLKYFRKYKDIINICFFLSGVLISAFAYKESLIEFIHVIGLVYILSKFDKSIEKYLFLISSVVLISVNALNVYFDYLYMILLFVPIIKIENILYKIILSLSIILPMVYGHDYVQYASLIALSFFAFLATTQKNLEDDEVKALVLTYSLMSFNNWSTVTSNYLFSCLLILVFMMYFSTSEKKASSFFLVFTLMVAGVKYAVVYLFLSEIEQSIVNIVKTYKVTLLKSSWMESFSRPTVFQPSVLLIISLITNWMNSIVILIPLYFTYKVFYSRNDMFSEKWFIYVITLVLIGSSLFFVDSSWSFFLLPDIFEVTKQEGNLYELLFLLSIPTILLAYKKINLLEDVFFRYEFYQKYKTRYLNAKADFDLKQEKIESDRSKPGNYSIDIITNILDKEKALIIAMFALSIMWRLF